MLNFVLILCEPNVAITGEHSRASVSPVNEENEVDRVVMRFSNIFAQFYQSHHLGLLGIQGKKEEV